MHSARCCKTVVSCRALSVLQTDDRVMFCVTTACQVTNTFTSALCNVLPFVSREGFWWGFTVFSHSLAPRCVVHSPNGPNQKRALYPFGCSFLSFITFW